MQILSTPLNATAEPQSDSPTGFLTRSATHLSFKRTDEFFHGMLSYRVRSEGPSEKGGNNLARLIYDACSDAGGMPKEKSESPSAERLQHFSQALETFGKWPKEFSERSESIRIFLDQANLRMGVPWKGTGEAGSGGFLGAVSQALVMIPLFSAAPSLFKVIPTTFSERYAVESPINIKLTNGTELLSIQTDNFTGLQTIRAHLCQDVQPDGSFQLSETLDCVSSDFPSKFQFFSPNNFLPSDGSGPRGSLAELLIIQQKPEDLTFSVVSASEGHVILQADHLSDHVFFSKEVISLQISKDKPSGSLFRNSFKITQVVCQGSKAGALHSRIKIDTNDLTECFTSASSPIKGTTQEIDRCDNVLMELMLCRALRTLSAFGNLHPCKLIMPVFVDDMDMLYPLSDRLSDKNSKDTSAAVKSSLEAILRRKLTHAEVGEWIEVSVKTVVKFYFDFQGLQLSNKVNRHKSIKEKASLVRMHFVSTVGIEADNSALLQYVSNNPLAHELLEFLDSCGLMHLHPVLVKHDITSVKEFSQLSQSAIEEIANEGHELSTRPLMKETVDICCAISAAQSSKFILPVSKRLELFEDKEASFLTVIHSTYAIYLALQKPFFSFGVQTIFCVMAFCVAIYEIITDPVIYLPFILPNSTRALWLIFAIIFVWKKSFKAAISSWEFWCFATGTAFVIGFVLDKYVNGKFEFGESKNCAANLKSSQLHTEEYSRCVHLFFVYFGLNAGFYWVLTYCILFRQDVVWRCLCIGISLQILMSIFVDSSWLTVKILGCIFVPFCLAVTETLRFYGSLQALQITKNDAIANAKRWLHVLAESRQDLVSMTQKLSESFDDSIYDRSSDLGKYGSAARVAKKPAPIRQPIKDFDDLYKVASFVNNTFQTWVESFFASDVPSANFLYVDDHDNIDHLHQHLRFESFRGIVSRGPVKLPERAIAKVTCLHHLHVVECFSLNCPDLSHLPRRRVSHHRYRAMRGAV
jgi:hypothetical protein